MYLEKNLASLKKRYPQYAEMILNAPLSGRYTTQPSARNDKLPNMVDRQAGFMFYNNVDPMNHAEQLIRAHNIRLQSVTVFMGFGLGYHIPAYIKTFNNSGIELMVVFEKDVELLKTAFTAVNFGNMFEDPRLLCCFGQQPVTYYPTLFGKLQVSNAKLYMQSINFIDSGQAVKADKDYYTNCVKSLKDAVAGILNLYGNDPGDSMIGIQNTFYNIETIIQNPGIKDLKGAFKGKPGVVVCTGPSLNKNIDLLKEIEDKAVIAAADASLRVMQKKGVIMPHFITSLERLTPTAKLFEGQTEESLKDIFFAACPVVHPQTYTAYPGEKIIVYRDFATFKWIGIEKGILEIGPSSGNMAFKILEYMGCNPIILIGQDLAYAGDLTHAEGSVYGERQEGWATTGTIMTEGNYVPQIRTNRVWNSFKKFYENDIAHYQGRLINATEGGAKIHGAELMTFREAIDTFIKKPLDVIPTVRKKLNKPFSAQQEKDRQSVRKKVADAIEYSDTLIARMKEGEKTCIDFLTEIYVPWQNGNQSPEDEVNRRYAKVESYLTTFSEEKFYLIFMHYVQSLFINTLVEVNGIKGNEDPSINRMAKLVEKFGKFYNYMINLLETMKKEFLELQKIVSNEEKQGD